jgi:hypothetical protein
MERSELRTAVYGRPMVYWPLEVGMLDAYFELRETATRLFDQAPLPYSFVSENSGSLSWARKGNFVSLVYLA